MKKIKYKVFVSRKKFNILSWIKNSSIKTYESFSQFLSNRNVSSPGIEYWDKAIKFYNISFKVEQPEPVQEPEPAQEPEPVQELEHVQETKPKKRRRRKNAEEQKQE